MRAGAALDRLNHLSAAGQACAHPSISIRIRIRIQMHTHQHSPQPSPSSFAFSQAYVSLDDSPPPIVTTSLRVHVEIAEPKARVEPVLPVSSMGGSPRRGAHPLALLLPEPVLEGSVSPRTSAVIINAPYHESRVRRKSLLGTPSRNRRASLVAPGQSTAFFRNLNNSSKPNHPLRPTHSTNPANMLILLFLIIHHRAPVTAC
jgi:hypothetical protein